MKKSNLNKREQSELDHFTERENGRMKSNKSLKDLLDLATLGDLKAFAAKYAKTNKKFRDELTGFLSDIYLDEEEGAEELIGRLEGAFMATTNIGDRWHRYDVTDWGEVCNESDKVLSDARRLLEMGNAFAALQVTMRLLELADNEDLNYVDEMDEWEMSDLFEKCGNLLVDSISSNDVPQAEKDEVVGKLRNMLKCELWNLGYLDTDDLLRRATAASQSDESMLRLLDGLISETSRDYDLVKYVRQKIALLEKMGRQKNAQDTIGKYIYLPGIRKDELQKALDKKDYKKALSLVEEGFRIAKEKGESGTEVNWMEAELDIHTRMGDKPLQQSVCRQLFVRKKGTMELYERLKQLVPPEEWKPFLKQLLSDTKMDAWYSSSIEADIYVAEKDVERLFSLLMDARHHTLDMFDKYAVHTGSEYSHEILTEYVVMLKDYASRNMGAKHYARIRHAMESMLKLKDGKSAAHQLADYFRETYRRRPSFMADIKKF